MTNDNDFDFQKVMSGFSGAFFGAIIGAIIGVLIYLVFNLLNVGIGITAKLAIVGLCIVICMLLFARYEVKKHP